MSCEELFLTEIRKRGYRLTPQREMVLSVLHEMGHAATAEEIFARVAFQVPNVELSTVYRTLDLLHSMDLVTIIDTGDKQRKFHLVGKEAPHLHLVCRVCGKVIGLELDQLQPLLDIIQFKTHFHTEPNNLTFSGICADCVAVPVTGG